MPTIVALELIILPHPGFIWIILKDTNVIPVHNLHKTQLLFIFTFRFKLLLASRKITGDHFYNSENLLSQMSQKQDFHLSTNALKVPAMPTRQLKFVSKTRRFLKEYTVQFNLLATQLELIIIGVPYTRKYNDFFIIITIIWFRFILIPNGL